MYCVKCGKQIKSDSQFCTYCGYKVNNINKKSNIQIKEYEFYSLGNGGKSKIIIDGSKITILRPGILSKFSHGFSGEKTILIKDITAVQFKPAGMGGGYLQFIFPGTKEKKSGMIRGEIDENIIYFDSTFNNNKVNNNAKEIKEYIENYNAKMYNNTVTNVYNTSDKYDKLSKIKKLLDEGVLSQEEFEAEKRKILH